MNTNFFNQIAHLQIIGDLHITIAKGEEDRLIVLVMLQNENCTDSAKNSIPPLNLRGTAEELDNGFFENITVPMQSASGLMVDMQGFMKQLDETKKQSAMEKEKADKQKKESEAKDKKYKEAMAKADELEKEGRHREAWMKVPEISEFPQYADEIRRRKTALSDKFSAPSLFGAVEQENTEAPKQEDLTADTFIKESETEEIEEDETEEE